MMVKQTDTNEFHTRRHNNMDAATISCIQENGSKRMLCVLYNVENTSAVEDFITQYANAVNAFNAALSIKKTFSLTHKMRKMTDQEREDW